MITLLFPCWNEKLAISRVIPAAQATCKRFQQELHLPAKVLVVDDGSQDGSDILLESYEGVQVLKNGTNKGYGYSLKKGIRASSSEWVAIMDLDSTIDPNDFIWLYQQAQDSDVSMIVGQRTHSHSSMPALRRIGNTLYSGTLFWLFKKHVKDPCSGARLIKKKTVEPLLDQLPDDLSFTLALTVLYLAQNQDFTEHPIFYGTRDGKSKLSALRDGSRFFKTIYSYSQAEL